MKTTAVFSLLLAPLAMAADKPAKCNADNCARAVTGTNIKQPLTARQSDCSKYMTTTVTPPAVTVTSTVQPVITPEPAVQRRRGLVRARDDGAATVPAYAATCEANGATTRYSSACACWGITAATVTAATPTTTTTVTAAPAPTGCAGPPGTCANGYLNGQGFFTCEDGGQCSCSPGDGRNVCYHHGSCGPVCATDADCAADGRVCVSETCCGTPVCLVPANVCPNAVAARSLFRAARRAPAAPRDLAEGDCTSLSCPSHQKE